MDRPHTLAILGGSGLYELDDLVGVEHLTIDTPYGRPSDVIVRGTLRAGHPGDAALSRGAAPTTLLFLPRHGRGHHIPPHRINYRANICALKMAGATHLVSVSAVGSMKENIAPGDFVVVDQFIDRTRERASTFFDDDVVAHVMFADPVCPLLANAVATAAESHAGNSRVHRGGTYLCMQGPQFSTRAESQLYRSWGVSVIGMTGMPEAKLAREAELPYSLLALATDYDCWHQSESAVSVETVVAVLQQNVARARRTLVGVAGALPPTEGSPATAALRNAILTHGHVISESSRKNLEWLVRFPISE